MSQLQLSTDEPIKKKWKTRFESRIEMFFRSGRRISSERGSEETGTV